MTTINKEELLNITKLSGISMNDADVALFTGQVQKVLSFIDQLQSVTITATAESVCNVNVFRDDVFERLTEISPLEQAPQKYDGYFIVPKVLD